MASPTRRVRFFGGSHHFLNHLSRFWVGYNVEMKTRARRVKHNRKRWVNFLIVAGTLVITTPLILRGIGAVLIYADPLEKADTAVALSGDTGDRVSESAWLYDHHYVDGLFITYTDEQARNALVNAAVKEGIPTDRIYVTQATVSNTVEEARAVRALATERAQDSLIIITDPFHTLRTRIIFRKELQGSGITVQVRPVVGHWYRSNTWWKTSEGVRYTTQEYLKILLYFFGKY